MGRVKLKIKRLESTGNRQVTYPKRRNGILKKARELSILCDIDIVLLMFSPTGRPTIFHGQRSIIEEIISRFSKLTPQERAKRVQALRKTFKKLDHDVNIQDFLGTSTQTVEELTNQVRALQAQLTEVHQRMRPPLSWLPNDDSQHMLVPNELNFMPQRDMGSSEDALIPGSSGFLCAGKEIEIGNSGQVDDMGHGGGNVNDDRINFHESNMVLT